MTKSPLSQSAAALVRALSARAGVDRNRILLTDVHSMDWQSLTFTGERHHIAFRITGRDSGQVAARMCAGLEDAEFSIAGMIVADLCLVGTPARTPSGDTELMIEALTVSED
jgi:hypothetical protein